MDPRGQIFDDGPASVEIVRVEQIDGLFNEIFADLLEKLTIIRVGKGVSWMLSSSINLDLDAFLLALLL